MDDVIDSKRQIDAIFDRRLSEMQRTINAQIAESRDAHAQYSVAIDRILSLQERFLEHDRREAEDHNAIMATIERVSATLAAHAEAIESLKAWNKGLTGILWASITGVVGWIITHITSSK